MHKSDLQKTVFGTLCWFVVFFVANESLIAQSQEDNRKSSRRTQTTSASEVRTPIDTNAKKSLLHVLTEDKALTPFDNRTGNTGLYRSESIKRDSDVQRKIVETATEEYARAVSVLEFNSGTEFGPKNSATTGTGVQQQPVARTAMMSVLVPTAATQHQNRSEKSQIAEAEQLEQRVPLRRTPSELLLIENSHDHAKTVSSRSTGSRPAIARGPSAKAPNVYKTQIESSPVLSTTISAPKNKQPLNSFLSKTKPAARESVDLKFVDEGAAPNSMANVAPKRSRAFANSPNTSSPGELRNPELEVTKFKMAGEIEFEMEAEPARRKPRQVVSLSKLKSALSPAYSTGSYQASSQHGGYSNLIVGADRFLIDGSRPQDVTDQLNSIDSEDFADRGIQNEDSGLNGPAKPSDMWLNNKSKYNWSTIKRYPRNVNDVNQVQDSSVDTKPGSWVESTDRKSLPASNRSRAIQITFGDQDDLELTDENSDLDEDEFSTDELSQEIDDDESSDADAAARKELQRAGYVDDLLRGMSLAPAQLAMNYVDDDGQQVPATENQKSYLIDFNGFYFNPYVSTNGRTDRFGCWWQPKCAVWKSPNYCHQPLYFEQVNLERFGGRFPFFQPAISGIHFFSSTICLPYNMALDSPRECQYSAGYGRPGNRYCYQRKKFTWNTKAGSFQALLAAAVVFGLP